MKIVHIISNLGDGGAEAMLYKIALHTKREINTTVVSLTNHGKYYKFFNENNIDVHCFKLKKNRLNIINIYKLYYFLKKNNPNLIQTWMSHSNCLGGILSKILGIQVYWNIRNSTLPKNIKLMQRFFFILNKYLSFFIPKKIIYCSKNAINFYEKHGYNKISVFIPNGFDPNIYFIDNKKRNLFRSKLNFNSDDFIIGMIARYHPQKNYHLFFKLIKELSSNNKFNSIKFVLAGSNVNLSNKEIIKNIGGFLGNRVYLLDTVIDTNSFYNGIDLKILLSSYGEGFPNVIAESMLAGTPCLSTNIGDTFEIIDKYGWIINNINTDEIIKFIFIIKENFKNNQKLQKLKINCSNHIMNNYNINTISKKYIEVWNYD